MCSTSRAMATSMTFSMRICRPAKERAWPSKLRFHSRMAATNSAPVEWPGLGGQRFVEFLQRLAGPERLLEAVGRSADARETESVLSMAIAQTQTEHTISPRHHRLDQPMGLPKQVEQREVGGGQRQRRRGDVGRIHGRVLSAIQTRGPMTGAARRRRDQRSDRQPHRARRPRPEISRGPKPDPPPAGPKSSRNLSKLGRNTGRSRLTKPSYP